MKRILILLAISLVIQATAPATAQLGGTTVYQLLNLPPTARSAALGGMAPSIWDNDPALVYHNPAIANASMNNRLSLNYSNYLADIQYGYLAYARDLGRFGTPVIGFQFLHYGEFLEADELGEIIGTFSAAEYSLNLSYAYRLDSVLTVGATLRPVYSVLERYTSFGLSADFGIQYHSLNQRFAATLVARNIGSQITTYATPDKENLPFEVLAGMNYKLKYAPFRLHLTARNLQEYNLRPDADPVAADAGFLTKTGRVLRNGLDHMVAGVEFVPGNLIALRVGYSFLRRAELKMADFSGSAGFTFGAGLNLGWLSFDYALASYHVAALTHTLSFRVNLNRPSKTS